MLSVRYFARF